MTIYIPSIVIQIVLFSGSLMFAIVAGYGLIYKMAKMGRWTFSNWCALTVCATLSASLFIHAWLRSWEPAS